MQVDPAGGDGRVGRVDALGRLDEAVGTDVAGLDDQPARLDLIVGEEHEVLRRRHLRACQGRDEHGHENGQREAICASCHVGPSSDRARIASAAACPLRCG
jgi:hypothetical protein